MPAYLQVEPLPADHKNNDPSRAFVDPHVLEHEGISENDIIEIESATGRTALVRVGEPLSNDHDTEQIRLDRHIRGSLKISIGDTVEISEADAQELTSVTLAPLSDVSGVEKEELAEYLKRSTRQRGALVNEDSIEYLTLPGADSGTAFKVVEAEPSSGIVTSETTVEVEYVFSTWGETQEVTFEDIGGLDEEVQTVQELVGYPLRYPDLYRRVGINPARGVILFGPPGTGKTRMIRAISNELDANFHYINGPSIISSEYGKSEQQLREVFTEAQQSLPSIVFIDELDAIAPTREETGSIADRRLVAQLLELMDGLDTTEGVMVIGTTNRIDSIEPALRRPGRFDRELYIGPPDTDSREEILGIHTRGMLLDEEMHAYLPTLAERTNGYTGADIMELCREAGVNALRREISGDWESVDRDGVTLSELVVEQRDFEMALRSVQPSVLRGVATGSAQLTWDKLGGVEDAKSQLRELIERPLEHPKAFAEMNLDAPTGILLVGESGTGKTALAKAAGDEFGVTFLQLETSDIFSQWVGQSENALKRVFRIATRSSPSIVLIDDLETIASARTDDASGDVINRVRNQLLTEIDRLQNEPMVTVIGTTNRPDLLDDAFLSASRFEEQIELSLPDVDERSDILSTHLQNTPTDLTSEDLQTIAEQTDGWTSANLASLSRKAKLAALDENEYRTGAVVARNQLETALSQTNRDRQRQ